jgi:hypothetical protein
MTRGFHLSSSSMFFSLEHTARLGGGRVPGGGRSAGGRGRRVETKPRAEGVAAAASGLGHVPEARGRAPGQGTGGKGRHVEPGRAPRAGPQRRCKAAPKRDGGDRIRPRRTRGPRWLRRKGPARLLLGAIESI